MALVSREYQLEKFYILIKLNGQIWFKVKEIIKILNINQEVLNDIDDCDCQKLENLMIFNLNQLSLDTVFINESGLYQLLFNSNDSNIMNFRRWITFHILPELRRMQDEQLQQQTSAGYIYVTTTKQLQKYNIYKIGKSVLNINEILEDLNSYTLSDDFEILFSIKVDNIHLTLDAINSALDYYKIVDKKFWFKMDLKNLIKCIIDEFEYDYV